MHRLLEPHWVPGRRNLQRSHSHSDLHQTHGRCLNHSSFDSGKSFHQACRRNHHQYHHRSHRSVLDLRLDNLESGHLRCKPCCHSLHTHQRHRLSPRRQSSHQPCHRNRRLDHRSFYRLLRAHRSDSCLIPGHCCTMSRHFVHKRLHHRLLLVN